jgi:hypothetical protein
MHEFQAKTRMKIQIIKMIKKGPVPSQSAKLYSTVFHTAIKWKCVWDVSSKPLPGFLDKSVTFLSF